MKVDLAKIRQDIAIFEHDRASSYLRAVFSHLKELQRSYTLNRYSEDLGFGNNNTMAQINAGHRKLSKNAAMKISTALKLNKAEDKYFHTLIDLDLSKSQSRKEELQALILELRGRYSQKENIQEELSFFNHWRHAVIFELLDRKEARTAKWLQQRFSMPIALEDVITSIELLVSLGAVEQQGEQPPSYVKAQEDFSAGNSVPGLAIVRFHQEMMNLAKESLVATPPQQRDISSVTISIDEALIDRIKQDIALFRHYLIFLSSQQPAKEKGKVMQVNIQLFPLSK